MGKKHHNCYNGAHIMAPHLPHTCDPPQDPRCERIPCTHAGTYADDCLCERVKRHRCYIVATCDRDLRRRIRKVMWDTE